MKIWKLPALLLLFLFGIVSCSSDQEKAAAHSEPDKVKAVMLAHLSFAPYFIAVKEGYFKEQNIEAESVTLQKGVDAIPQLLQGNIDVAGGFLDAAFINGLAQGGTGKIVAERGTLVPGGCTYMGLMQNAQAPVTDWAGARVGSRLDTFYGYYLEQLLKTKGLSLDDIKAVNISPAARISAMANKSVDLVTATQPFMQQIKSEGGAELIHSAQSILPNTTFGFVYYSSQFIKNRKDVAQRFMVAYLKGVRKYNEGKTSSNLQIIAEYTKLDQDLLKEICWPVMDNTGKINEESVMAYQAWLLKQKLIDEEVGIEKLWDSEFVENALKTLENK